MRIQAITVIPGPVPGRCGLHHWLSQTSVRAGLRTGD
ncbi:hypothetical protein HDA39_000935 [Kribbella italica]|uniref:Uncharacterized protein n=1 Tax=Kribbella italica TaxID=1540520 RepID=A0A7W9J217_9ACTN|nr:hypothetical protein [Kribbella italica]